MARERAQTTGTLSKRSVRKAYELESDTQSIIFLVVALAHGVQAFLRVSQDKWWTPMNLAPTAEEAKDRVAIYVDGQWIGERTDLGEERVRYNNHGTIAREWLSPIAFGLGIEIALVGVSLMLNRGAAALPPKS